MFKKNQRFSFVNCPIRLKFALNLFVRIKHQIETHT